MINIFGTGFVGSEFAQLCPNAVVNLKTDYKIKTDQVVYFISTVDNYNVLDNPKLDIETNLITLMDVLSTGKTRPNLEFNFISSWFVYGRTELPAREDAHCDPRGFYSITKRAAEQLIISYCETFNLNYRIIRLGNVIGPGDKKVSAKKNALQYMINCLKNDEPIKLYDNGDHLRDYIDVKDAAAAIKLIIEKSPLNNIYNVGNGEPVRIGDVIEYVYKKIGSKSEITYIKPSHLHNVVQTTDFYLDVTKLKNLGYKRKIQLYDTIDRILAEK